MNDNTFSRASETVNESSARQLNSPKRILVVEDDEDIRGLIAESLNQRGYRTDEADNGAVAWETLQQNSYDLMITDNTMPKMSGVELIKNVRAARMVLPIIMATASLPEHTFAKSTCIIPDATLVKPFTIEELVMMVKRVLTGNSVFDQETPTTL